MTDTSTTQQDATAADDSALAADAVAAETKPATTSEPKASKPTAKAKADKPVELELTTNGRTVVFPQSIEADVVAWFSALTLQPDLELPEGARFKE